ncbi:MAG: carbohydrate-binding domain-containing protein, partial [Elusimicrobiales bacterium]|nr:carbohydrate-binding domain-containing protein [Elusimicrobiales bacterium]
AIYVSEADKVYITLEDGTNNRLSDGGEYSESAETNACIHSKTDLEIDGNGSLTVNGNVHNGISAKDDFEISGGAVNITAVNDGIHVNDTAEVNGGSVSITAGGDGIQSESILDITDGSISVECTGEVTVTDTPMFGMGGRAGRITSEPEPTGEPADEDTEDTSSKGIKAGWMLDISGGEVTINSNDTCVKCDSELNISGGTLTLTSDKKKGIKGMEDVNISGGKIDIKKSTEGIETKRIMTISGGDIDVIASDDGFNAGGDGMGFGGGMQPPERPEDGIRPGAMEGEQGLQMPESPEGGIRPEPMEGEPDRQPLERPADEAGMMHRGGMGGRAEATEVSAEHHIEISGGDIYINAQGDGIDSNGSLIISGGSVIVDGPEMGGDSALDHDGLFEINGGTVIAVSSAGMIENPSEASAQNVISAYITAANGSEITIKSSSGQEVCSYKVNKNAGHIMFSSAELAAGEAYTVYVDGTEAVSGEIQSALTVMGSAAGGFGGRGGQGGMRLPRNPEERPMGNAN